MKQQFAIFLFLLFIIYSFRLALSPLQTLREAYLEDVILLEKSLLNFQQTALTEGGKNHKKLQYDFKTARLAYKKVAWLLACLEPQNEKNFNGAPFPSVELVQFNEIEPIGFQVIENIIFSNTLKKELPKLQQQIEKLLYFTKRWHDQIKTQALSDREIWEGFRLELIQLYTLSLAGFDSPLAAHSLPEAFAAWTSLQKYVYCYQKNWRGKTPSVSQDLTHLFEIGKVYLQQNQDFNTFDRIEFYKKYWQPLYQKLIIAQQDLGIEFYELTSGTTRAWNDTVFHIFDKNFFNPKFYSGIKQKTHKDFAERINLGKKLFYDPILSANGKRSCVSCHIQERGFSDSLAQSLDLDGNPLTRNSPSLNYSALSTAQFWDGRSPNLEDQFFHVAINSREMGNSIEDLPIRIKKQGDYDSLFQYAFPHETDPINVPNIQRVIGAYLRTLPTFESDFDKFMRDEKKDLSKEIQLGFNLFMGKAKCGTCHFAPIFNGTTPPQYADTEFEVLGIYNHKKLIDNDLGKYLQIPTPKYYRSFKTVTVRNVAVSAPYMHNGQFKTLTEVIDFYNKGGGQGIGLDVSNQTLPPDLLHLSKREKKALIRFMESLTDK